jgi:hypothetical protein
MTQSKRKGTDELCEGIPPEFLVYMRREVQLRSWQGESQLELSVEGSVLRI